MDLSRGQHVLRPGTRIGAGRGRPAGDGRLRAGARLSATACGRAGDRRRAGRAARDSAARRGPRQQPLRADDRGPGRRRRGRLARARARRRGRARAARCAMALQSADVLITSGGVSMGTRDLIKPLLERLATHSVRARLLQTGQAADVRDDRRWQAGLRPAGLPRLVAGHVRGVRSARAAEAGGADQRAAPARRGRAGARRFGPMPCAPSISALR